MAAQVTVETAEGQQAKKPSRHAHLASSAFDFLQIVHGCKTILKKLLSKSVEGSKILVLEQNLIAQLTLFIEVSELKSWGFNEWHPLGKSPAEILPSLPAGKGKSKQRPEAQTIFILLRCEIDQTRLLAQQLPTFLAAERNTVVVGMLPRPTEETLRILLNGQNATWAKLGRLIVRPVPMYLVPLDVDLLSLEIPDVFVKFYAIESPGCLNLCAEGLLQLQRFLGGLIPRLWCVGRAAKCACSQLLRFRWEIILQLARIPEIPTGMPVAVSRDVTPVAPFHLEATESEADEDGNETLNAPFDRFNKIAEDLVIIDRRVDLFTPLCTPFSYEAVLDNMKGIRHGTLVQGHQPGQPKLNSSDPVFEHIRYKSQGEVAAALHEKATTIQETYKAKEQLQSIEEIGKFLHVFKSSHSEHAAIAFHVNLLQEMSQALASADFQDRVSLEDEILGTSQSLDSIHKALEVLAENEEDPTEVYRLLCLFHLAAGGLKPAFLEPMRKLMVENFGLKELIRMERLGISSLLPHVTGTAKALRWAKVQQTFRLLTPQDDSAPPGRDAVALSLYNTSQGCLSTLFAGYTPLSCRLVQLLYTPGGWKDATSALDSLWGPAIEVRQTLVQRESTAPPAYKDNVTVVVFLGGCTYGEVGVLRMLGRALNRRFVVITTEMLNSKSFLRSFEPTESR